MGAQLLNMDCNDLVQAQQDDIVLQTVRDWVLNDNRPPYAELKDHPPELRQFWKEFPKLTFVDVILCRRVRPLPGDPILQVVVPTSLKKSMFETLHGHSLSGHFCARKTLEQAFQH